MRDMDGVGSERRAAVLGGRTRRGWLGLGARLALAAPAVLAGLQFAGSAAHADDGEDNGGDRGDNRGRGDNQLPNNNNQPFRRGNTFNSDLVVSNAVNLSDLGANISDSGSGSLSVSSNGTSTSSVQVVLQGATANQTYTLAFVPLSSTSTRQSLGSFTTDGNGNGRLSLGSGLPESGNAAGSLGTRVGVFVLRRGDINGPDAFVTAA